MRHHSVKKLSFLLIPLGLFTVLFQIATARQRMNVPLLRVSVVKVPNRMTNDMRSALFSSDGRHVFGIDTYSDLTTFDAESGAVIAKWSHSGSGDSHMMALGGDNRTLYAAYSGGGVNVFDVKRGKLRRRFRVDHKGLSSPGKTHEHYSDCVLSADGSLALATEVWDAFSIWETATGKRRFYLAHPNLIGSLARSTCGATIAPNNATFAVAQLLLKANPANPKEMSIRTPAGVAIELRDTQSGKLQATIMWPNADIEFIMGYEGILRNIGMAFSPDGRFLAGMDKSKVVVWDVASRKEMRRLVRNRGMRYGGYKRLAFSPSGRLVAMNYGDFTEVWDAKDGRFLQSYRSGGLNSPPSFSPDGKNLLTCSHDARYNLSVWDISSLH